MTKDGRKDLMTELVKLTINDTQYEAPKGSLLIDKLLKEKITIPHFCYHPSLGTDGNCRMCMVEIAGQKRPQIACDTLIKDDMVIYTKGEKIDAVQRDILELQLVNHPLDCPTCDQAGECKLQDFYMDSGFYVNRVSVPKNNALKKVDLGANVMLDQERCVLCTRCVRFTTEFTGTGELGVISRADHSVIDTFPGLKLHNPYAMNVVDLCPVGALTSKDFRFKQRSWFLESFHAICNGCSRGCNLQVDHRKEKYNDDKIYRFRPLENQAVNGYFICDEGRLSYKNENENRFLTPLVNNNEKKLDETKDVLVTLLKEAKDVLFLISPNLSLEEMQSVKETAQKINATVSGFAPQYLDQSFADKILKTNDKSANRAGYKKISISEEENEFQNSLKNASLVVIFENSYFDDKLNLLDNKKVISLFSANSKVCENSDVAIPIASFLEKSGSYINCTGVTQEVSSKMNKNNQSEDIRTLLESINVKF